MKRGEICTVTHPCFVKTSVHRPRNVVLQDYHQTAVPLLFIIFPRREIKARRFPSPPHLDQISGRLLVDHGETLGDYGHSSLPVSVSLRTDSCNPGKSVRSHR